MSKFPEKIDSSIELPIVRNNVIEVGSDAINKIRAAVINIERAIGINPNGQLSSLSDRLSNCIDDLGNIKPSAINNLNLISGPVKDSDISNSANISESKLDLDFSTKYLQTELLIISSKINDILMSVQDIMSKLVLHISSLNAHPADAISVSEIAPSLISTANQLGSGSLQDFLNNSLNSHMNFSNAATSSNKSHSASQIYLDPELVDGISETNLQSAIEALSTKGQGSVANLIHNYFNSHYPTDCVVGDRYIEDEVLSEGVLVSYNSYNASRGESGSFVTISIPSALPLRIGDICVVSNEKYIISEINYSDSARTIPNSVFLENFYPTSSSFNSTVSFILKVKDSSSEIGLSSVILKRPNSGKKDFIQVLRPELPHVVASEKPDFSNFLSSNYISLNINGTEYFVYFSKTSTTMSELIDELNYYCSSNNIAAIFFKFNSNLAVASLITDAGSTFKISPSSHALLGFSDLEEKTPTLDRLVLVGRKEYNSSYEVLNLELEVSSDQVTSTSVNFLELGVSTSSTIIINEKRYFVSSVNSSSIFLYNANISAGTYVVKCFDDSALVSSFNQEVFGSLFYEGSILSGYIDSKNRLSVRKDCDFLVPINGSDVLLDFEIKNKSNTFETLEVILEIKPNDTNVYIKDGNVSLPIKNTSYIKSGSSKIEIFTGSHTELYSFMVTNSLSTFSCFFRFYPEDIKDDLYLFSCKTNKSSSFIYSLTSAPNRGYLETNQLSNQFLENSYFERNLFHKNKIISGFSIKSVSDNNGYYSVEISGGIAVIGGKIISTSDLTLNTLISYSSNDVIYIYVSEDGDVSAIEASNPIGPNPCSFTLDLNKNLPFGSIEYYSGNFYSYSLSNYNISANGINIGNVFVDPEFGSVKTFGDAVRLCKRYFDAFGSYPAKIILSPKVHSTYVDVSSQISPSNTSSAYVSSAWDSGIFIDFPITIEGQGRQSVLTALTSDSSTEAHIILNYGATTTFGRPRLSAIDGDVTFKNLTIKDCSIQIRNKNIVESSETNVPYFTNFDNVHFEFDSISSTGSDSGIIFVNDNANEYTGNLSVRNSLFTYSRIIFLDSYPTYIQGLSIIDNRVLIGYYEFIKYLGTETLPTYKVTNVFDFFFSDNLRNTICGNICLGNSRSYTISNDLFWKDINTNYSSVGASEFLGPSIFNSMVNVNDVSFNMNSTIFNMSQMQKFRVSGDIAAIFANKSPDDNAAISLSNGTIRGLQRVRFRNFVEHNVAIGTTNSGSWLFNFSENSPVNNNFWSSQQVIPNHSIRLDSANDIHNGIYLSRIIITTDGLYHGKDIDLEIKVGSVPYGSVAVTPGVGPEINGNYCTINKTIYSTQTNRALLLDIDEALDPSNSGNNGFTSRYVSRRSLVIRINAKVNSSNPSDTADDVRFGIDLDLEMK
jgi:hypothetical protein